MKSLPHPVLKGNDEGGDVAGIIAVMLRDADGLIGVGLPEVEGAADILGLGEDVEGNLGEVDRG